MRIPPVIAGKRRTALSSLSLLLVLVIGLLDYVTGTEPSLLVFYVIPVAISSWAMGRWWGVFVSAASAAAWMVADLQATRTPSQLTVIFWNTLVELGVFSFIALSVSSLRDAMEREEVLNRELEAFSYSIAHDLKTPLIVIHGFAARLLRDRGDKEERDSLEIIAQSSRKMLGLIDELLAFSRSGRQKMEVVPVDMEELVREVITDLSPTAAATANFIVGPLPRSRGDRALLRQVFYNFIANAIKFSRLRESPVIEVGGREEERELIYYVRDNGAGFDEASSERLFTPFERLHREEEFEGTGLGLAIVSRIVQRHGGRVWAEGRLNEGAVFSFSLPKWKASETGLTGQSFSGRHR